MSACPSRAPSFCCMFIFIFFLANSLKYRGRYLPRSCSHISSTDQEKALSLSQSACGPRIARLTWQHLSSGTFSASAHETKLQIAKKIRTISCKQGQGNLHRGVINNPCSSTLEDEELKIWSMQRTQAAQIFARGLDRELTERLQVYMHAACAMIPHLEVHIQVLQQWKPVVQHQNNVS